MSATQVVPLTITETIRQADTIVVGTVVSQKTRWGNDAKRWMLTDYEFAVEDLVFTASDDVAGKTIVVTYWGGTLDGETQAVSDTRLPVVGERLLLMLKPGWQKSAGFSPVVGLNFGLFAVVSDGPDRPLMVRDSDGRPLAKTADGAVQHRNADVSLPPVSLDAFVAWIRAQVGAIKAAPSELPPQAHRNDPRAMQVFARPHYLPVRGERGPEAATRPPRSDAAPQAPAAEAPSPVNNEAAGRVSTEMLAPLVPNYSYARVANLPINVNNLPDSFAPWSPEDEFQMGKWNYYADIFRVFTTPTGNWAWQNDRFDLCGWPSSADMQAQFGAPWDANTIAICYTRWNSSTNIILEGDIAFNPAWTFTLDDESVYDGGTARSYRQVLSHELGHMWGLSHQFNFLSIMNDSQSQFRFFGFPYMDDAEAIRAAYPSVAAARTDLAVYLRRGNGTQSITDATYASNATAGGTITVNNYHVENVGTTTITAPRIEWYLTSARNYNSTYYYIGESTYGALTRFNFFDPPSTSRTFTIPASVPGGSYYLNAYIRNDGGASQGSFPVSNNEAFSRTRIAVAGATYTVTPSAGSNGTISPSTPQSVAYNGSRTFTATPSAEYIVNQWFVNGSAVRNGGTSYTLTNVTANTNVSVSFMRAVSALASRKAHPGAGNFDVDLPVSGTAGVEPRQTSQNHTLIFTFANPLTSFGSAFVSSGTGSVTSTTAGTDPRQVFVNVSGATDVQTLRVTIPSVVDSLTNTAIVNGSVGLLIGDTNGDRAVNSGDALQTRGRSGQTLNSSNFRSDVNADGAINSGDSTVVRARSSNFLP